jgi:transposase
MSRHELTDAQWAILEPLFPKPNPKGKRGPGRPRNDSRPILNGILYVLKTGCAWEDIPRRYTTPSTGWRRLQEWTDDGTWEKVWRALLGQLDVQDKLEWAQAFLDGSFVPAKKGGLE